MTANGKYTTSQQEPSKGSLPTCNAWHCDVKEKNAHEFISLINYKSGKKNCDQIF